jgi:hypothetical protein
LIQMGVHLNRCITMNRTHIMMEQILCSATPEYT